MNRRVPSRWILERAGLRLICIANHVMQAAQMPLQMPASHFFPVGNAAPPRPTSFEIDHFAN